MPTSCSSSHSSLESRSMSNSNSSILLHSRSVIGLAMLFPPRLVSHPQLDIPTHCKPLQNVTAYDLVLCFRYLPQLQVIRGTVQSVQQSAGMSIDAFIRLPGEIRQCHRRLLRGPITHRCLSVANLLHCRANKRLYFDTPQNTPANPRQSMHQECTFCDTPA